MWFVLLAIGLVVLALGGTYFRRRVLVSLSILHLPARRVRVAGLVLLWLLFAYPLLVFGSVMVSLALGRAPMTLLASEVASWLLAFPFWIALLVMLQALPYFVLLDVAHVLARRHLDTRKRDVVRAMASLGVCAVFAVYTPVRIAAERGALEVRRYELGEASAESSLRIVFLSDLQLDQHTGQARAEEVVARIREQAPDLILVGGDWINVGDQFIDAAAEIGGRLRSPMGVFSVRGDHDHFAYADRQRSIDNVHRALSVRGVEMLDNEVRWFEKDGQRIAVVFLSDNYIRRASSEDLDSLLDQARRASYSILVSHRLDASLAERIRGRVDLVLAGHTHGGQVNPVLGLVHVPLARVETPYVSGRYQLGPTTAIVSSGIGYSVAPFRYACPATIEVIDLRW